MYKHTHKHLCGDEAATDDPYFVVLICHDLTANNYSGSDNNHDFYICFYRNSLFVNESMIVFVFYTKAPWLSAWVAV